jgi:hypothetical protein
MKELIKNIIKEELNKLSSENTEIEFVQFMLDGVVNDLRKKCVSFFDGIDFTDEQYEVDYDSVDLCRELESIESIKVLKLEESSYYFNLDFAVEYSDNIPRTVGYGMDHLISEIELKMKKYFNKQVNMYPENE